MKNTKNYQETNMITETTRKKNIKKILKSFNSLTAFKNQIKFMNSVTKQFEINGDLSDKQIDVAKKIIKQNQDFSRMWRHTRCMEKNY